ncbi:hypothetical protein [Cyclobacterium marinum]|uniref:hypothetical protein n=1 Tax=Cyclobacterium marinum TaxID=104 RepID=UPI0011EE411B|nr:hypothetical protein [Cyclobacterium marinum]MBI0397796.1 hypothetical protein [Cyclobacterium marinum]
MDGNELNLIDLVKLGIQPMSALIGVIIGAIVTTITSWKLKTKETKLRLIEKIFERKIIAHEEILSISQKLKNMIPTYEEDDNLNIKAYPAILKDRDSLDSFLYQFSINTNRNSHWADNSILKELYYIQDYFANLEMFLKNKNVEIYPKIGEILRLDFVELASGLEKIALVFFEKDIYKLNKHHSSGHHKYPIKTTKDRLDKTILLKEANFNANDQTIS